MINDIFRASFVFDAPNANPNGMVYTAHFRVEANGTATSPVEEGEDLANILRTKTESFYCTLIPDVITLREVNVIGISEPTVGVTEASGVSGSDTSDSMPYRNAVHSTNRTGLRGRSYNGRTNLMPCSESQTNEGIILASYQTSVVAYLVDLANPTGALFGTVFQQVIWSRKLQIATDVTQIVTSNRFATVGNRQEA